ncbi:MAG TPA: YjgN family protein [Allosphingosinicella sp.]|jgi:uncharacterized membrane protein YjgN (DUF898 family)
MNEMRDMRAAHRPASAFTFTGTWREFLPIALTNLLLTVVTLGIYRFWAKARERRYLWSRTHFIDDHLEWTGTGKEMFIGFLVVMLVLLPLFLAFQFGLQSLVLRGEVAAAGALTVILYGGFFYLIGVGQFRALRYRLSRTWWHGIRGGSFQPGWSYGFKFLWKMFLGYIPASLLLPWSMVSLWNDRFNEMSFGPHQIEARADTDGLFGRWLLIYLAVIVGVIGALVLGFGIGASTGSTGAGITAAILAGLGLYVIVGVASLAFYAAYYRKVVGATSFGGLGFEFTARTADWFKLILGNIALVVLTLGFGMMFVGYRNWAFFVRYMEATGEIDLDHLTQSATSATSDAEGLADAFDIGAI